MSRIPLWRKQAAEVTPAEQRVLLAANDLFRDLSETILSDVEKRTNMSSCDAGQVLFEPEQSGEVLFVLKRGHVQIYRLNPDGKKLIVSEVRPGGFFGEMALLGQGMFGNFAEATEESLICAMSRADILELFQRYPDVSMRVVDRLAQRLQEAESRLEVLAYQRLEARLASALLHECDPDDQTVHGLSQQDLAEIVGASRESVTRLLNQMAKNDVVRISRRKIVLLDVDALRALMSTPDG